MKFENLIKIVLNEADLGMDDKGLEDSSELNADVGSDIGADAGLTAEPVAETVPMTDQEKIEYLMKYSKVLNRNQDRTDAEKRAHAAFIVKNGYFDQFADVIDKRQEAEADEVVNPETEIDYSAPRAEDLKAVEPSLRAHKSLRDLEDEDALEAMGSQD